MPSTSSHLTIAAVSNQSRPPAVTLPSWQSLHQLSATNLMKYVLQEAVSQHASDIHIDPQSKHSVIRMRIDGILKPRAELPPHLARRVTTHLKALAGLDIANHHLPQDGRFEFKSVDNTMATDCRINTCPTSYGERAVIRLLHSSQHCFKLDELGLSTQQYDQLRHALLQPQGMLLTTGPTGSGKTATLYAALDHINTHTRCIVTIEDPVEIRMPGLNQIAINQATGLTTDTALRALLRQDPDVMMLGEIRDQDTLETAMQAAHTGHLVLASLHTQGTLQTITRLLHMGVSTYNLAHTLHIIIAQRLVRRLCLHCKKIDTKLSAMLDHHCYMAQGCVHCHEGYAGRTGLFEILTMQDELRAALLNQVPLAQLRHIALEQGLVPLREAANHLLKRGMTSMAEIRRVCGHPTPTHKKDKKNASF